MKITSKGIRVIVALATVSFLTSIFNDIILFVLALTLFLVLMSDFFRLRFRVKEIGYTKTEPSKIEVRMVAGENREIRFQFRPPIKKEKEVEFTDIKKWIKPVKIETPLETTGLTLNINPQIAGEYFLDGLEGTISSPLKLFNSRVRIPFSLYVKTYPRVLPWIVEAVRLLEFGVGYGAGVFPGKKKGLGLEYIETREYTPGDPVRLIDWKATARLTKLMVKEFLEESSGSIYLIYDSRSLGPITSDMLSALLLSTMVGLAYEGLPVNLTLKSGLDIVFNAKSLNPMDALKIILAYLMETSHVSEWDVYELLEPKSSQTLLRTLKMVKAEGLKRLAEFKLRSIEKTVIMKNVKASVQKLNIVYIGSIIHDSSLLMELAEEAKLRGHRFRVMAVNKPWVDAKNLEEAYTIYVSQQKILRALQKLKTEVVYTFKP